MVFPAELLGLADRIDGLRSTTCSMGLQEGNLRRIKVDGTPPIAADRMATAGDRATLATELSLQPFKRGRLDSTTLTYPTPYPPHSSNIKMSVKFTKTKNGVHPLCSHLATGFRVCMIATRMRTSQDVCRSISRISMTAIHSGVSNLLEHQVLRDSSCNSMPSSQSQEIR